MTALGLSLGRLGTPFPPAQRPRHPETPSFFTQGPLACGAAIAPGRWPVVLLSHGTGGTADSLGWLAESLARAGYVVLGPNHHGNTGLEPTRPEGFLCWWERSHELSFLLSLAIQDLFPGQLDETDVAVLGFSLGGYAALTLLGARTDMNMFADYIAQSGLRGPKEFPDLIEHIEALQQSSARFAASWAVHGQEARDARISRAVALAAAPPVRALTPASLATIALPVTLITGGSDTEAPTEVCSAWLGAQNPAFHHIDMGPDVGHYTFLGFPARSPVSPKARFLFEDRPGVDRAQVHAATLAEVKAFLSAGQSGKNG